MDLEQYIQHPELLDRETLFDLRNLVARYPYHQVARILMLQNLYLLHNPTFDEEIRRSAFYITDRTTLFNLVEAVHYQFRTPETKSVAQKEPLQLIDDKDRTGTLIDIFLESVPPEEPEEKHRKPTPADATLDYMAYLMETEQEEDATHQDFIVSDEEEQSVVPEIATSEEPETGSKQSAFDIIDNFLENEGGKLEVALDEDAPYVPERDIPLEDDDEEVTEDYFTETLAKIYVKQGRYSKAFEIIQRLNMINPQKNAYFADQLRFLEKIIANEQSRKNKKTNK